jgi:porin
MGFFSLAWVVTAVGLAALGVGAPAWAADPADPNDTSQPYFGGPGSVEGQLDEDDDPKSPVVSKGPLTRYFNWKKEMQKDHGFSFGLDYSGVYFAGNNDFGEDAAGSGMIRFYGAWDLVGRGKDHTGAVVWKVENRHRYTDLAASELGFAQGYVGLQEPPFSNQQNRLTNLYWRHRLFKGRLAVVGGFLDATDYVDVFGLGSPWLHFANFAFSTGTQTIALPNDALVGFAAGGMVTKNLFVIGGIADTNSDPTEPLDGVGTFFDEKEHFYHLEIGWTTSQDRIYFDNSHLTLWKKDEQREAGIPEGKGAAFSWSHFFAEKWMPFVRGGWSDEGGTLMTRSISAGAGYAWVPGRFLVGLGINWGEPNEDTFGPDLDNQTSTELFLRVQLTQWLAVTPDVQWLQNPALNPEDDSILLFGFRARAAF